MLFDILDRSLDNLTLGSKAGSSPADPTTKKLFKILLSLCFTWRRAQAPFRTVKIYRGG